MRKTMIWVLAAGALTIGGGAFLFGCSDATSDRPPVSQLKDGVNLLDVKDPATAMNAAFVKNGRVVYVQTRIGGPKPDIYRQTSPNEPPNETDMRFVNGQGMTFAVQRGGDTYVDATWEAEVLRAATTPVADTAERDADFALAVEAAQALTLALPPSFKDHTFHLAAYAQQPLPTDALNAHAVQVGEKGYVSGGWSNGVYTQLWSHKLCFAWVCPAWHSSTVTYNGAGGQVIMSCNHGACGSSGNSYQCTSGGPGSGSITGEGYTNKSISGGCLSGYNWDTPPGHECNSDATYELWQTNNGSTATWYGDGWSFNYTDYNGHNYQCSTGSGGGSGDWQRPVCP